MSDITRLERIRCVVREAFARNGASSVATPEETFLMRDGCYCGRRFETQGWRAVWFIEEDELKIYSPEGRLVDRLPAGRFESELLARAA